MAAIEKSLENFADKLFYNNTSYKIFVSCFEEIDIMKTGELDLKQFHKILIDNSCMILLEEV